MRYHFTTTILLSVGLVSTALLQGSGLAQGTPQGAPETVQLLFVQNSTGVAIDKVGRTLTLKGVSPTTLFFSDRPVRIAGHFHTKNEFLPLWTEGKDSFLKDPPNATLSVFEKGRDDLTDVVVKLQNPRLKGSDLLYTITVLEGRLPKIGGPASLFIDIIGLPWTPFSYAGVARRWTRRAVLFGPAYTSAAAAAAIAAHPAPVYVTPPPPPTVIVTPPPPPPAAPAPALPASQASAVARLKELKSMLNDGLITQSQYQEASQKILNQLAE
jgi:hypothetical protein